MRILHYSLGFPPLRTGGLVKYSVDLAKEQSQKNNQVFFLYPGNIKIFNKKVCIRYDKHHSNESFHSYALINSLPLPLFGGIRTPGSATLCSGIDLANCLITSSLSPW